MHRVLEPVGVLPQAAQRLDTDPVIRDDEVRVRVQRLNLDAASFRQLEGKHGGDGDAVRAEVLEIVRSRGKMHNPVTGSGGMLVGTVEEVGEGSPLGLAVGDRDRHPGLPHADPSGHRGRPRAAGTAAASRSRPTATRSCSGAASPPRLPEDLPAPLALSVMDVCGAPALTERHVARYADPTVVVIGGAGKSGSLCLAAARRAGAARVLAVVPHQGEADLLEPTGLADQVLVCDARDPVALRDAVAAAGGPADLTVVCVDVPGCEGGAMLSTDDGGTVIFFSMATSFSAAALGAEGLAADVTMVVGNGYVPGHADLALEIVRSNPAVRALFERRL